jgi:hypothetical protein
MSAIVANLNPVLVLPTCEEVFYVAAAGLATPVFAPSPAVLRRLHSKYTFALDASAAGLPTPLTTRFTSQTEIDDLLPDADALVFKPEFSRFGTNTLVSPSADALCEVRPSEQTPWVAQKRVHGAEFSFYAVSVESRLTAFSAYHSPWKFDGGAGYAFETLEPSLHERLCDIARRLAEKLIPQGQFACDVIVDQDGAPWLLECNPRATSGVHLFDRRADLALAILGRASEPLVEATPGARHVGPALWAYGLPEALKQKRLSEWSERLRKSADVISAPNDHAPIAGALLDTLSMGISAAARGKSLTEIATIDIEWNGEPL